MLKQNSELEESMIKVSDPAKAKEFFDAKMAFTTGPIETERMINNKENVLVVDVRAAEDFSEGHIPISVKIRKDSFDIS